MAGFTQVNRIGWNLALKSLKKVAPVRRSGRFYMVTFKSIAGITLAAAAMGMAAPAAAETVLFNFNGNTSVNGTYGNSKQYSVTVNGVTVNLLASAWTATPKNGGGYTISSAYMGRYSHGLGATAANDSNGGGNLHTIDNKDSFDFILFQFDQSVSLVSAILTPFSIGNNGYVDNDASIGYGDTNQPWNTKLNLANSSVYNGLFDQIYSVKGTGKAADVNMAINPNEYFGNTWMIGADFFGVDSLGRKKFGYDSFKLNGLTLNTANAVPEPATWAMMIAGFGLVGAGLRRRRAVPATA